MIIDVNGEKCVLPDEPITREDKYMAYLCSVYSFYPKNPATRKEQYLYYLCKVKEEKAKQEGDSS